MRTVTLIEHETAAVGEAGPKSFTTAEVDELDRAQKTVGVEALRWTSRAKVKATQNVGMLAAGSVRLEILPKISGLDVGSTRNALMGMIATAWDVPVHDGEITTHGYQQNDLLELLIGLFARRLQTEVRRGLARAYVSRREDLSRLRGKLDTTRQLTTLAATPWKLACRFEEFTPDTPINRLLLCAINHLRRRSLRRDNQRLLSEIAVHFEDVAEISVSEAIAQTIAFDRSNRRWAVPARLAQLLLASIYQTAHSGSQDGVALLFDMNRLFEAYVASLVRRALTPHGYKVRIQSPQRSLARGQGGNRAFLTRPDIHVERERRVTVIDTKWKEIDPTRPNFSVVQSDAYQMHGYAHVYAAASTILIYPHHDSLSRANGSLTKWQFEVGGCLLCVATVDICRPDAFTESLLTMLREAA